MRGVTLIAALGIVLGAWSAACADASELDGVRTLAREKAAAIGLMRTKAADILTTVAQDRLFGAYLNATTQGEGARVRTRIAQALATFIRRFGLTSFQLIDRSGVVVTYVSTTKVPPDTQVDVQKDRLLAAGFAAEAPVVASVVVRRPDVSGWSMSLSAPVNWHGQTEYVLRAEQDQAAYRRVLGLGLDSKRYVLLADERDQILLDSRPKGSAGDDAPTPGGKLALTIAGQSLPALRRLLGGGADEGSGLVSRRNENFNVSYRKVGDWTVVAVEPVLPPRRCTKDGERLCG